MDPFHIAVVTFSDMFSDLWPRIANEIGARYLQIDPSRPITGPRGLAAIVLAMGGEEADASEWLRAHAGPSNVPVLGVGSDTSHRTAAHIVADGAADYFALPGDLEILHGALQAAVRRCEETFRREAESARLATGSPFAPIVGDCPALLDTLSRAERMLSYPEAVALIAGETGTGKELLARALHRGSARSTGPFVTVDCSAFPHHLVESELFGHERGAFADAHAPKPGLFELADGGTLFLEEVGTLSLEVQAKLLRALEDKEIRRVGATRPRTVDVRVIAATTEELDRAAAQGSMRQDLYYRLSVITLWLPPLRERGSDVLTLAEGLVTELASRHRVDTPSLSIETRKALTGYHWPGNIGELKNALERSLLLSPPGQLEVRELFPRPTGLKGRSKGPLPFPAGLDEINHAAAHATLQFCAGNRSEAARRLGISRQRLRRLLAGELQIA
jgi:two-component system, NtrC family, response regulator HydG